MSSPKRVAVITGANKGIGLEICRQLAANDVRVILTARDVERGFAAARKLQDLGLPDVVFHQLDVVDKESIESLKEFIRTQFGKLDILVNNAGVVGSTVLRREGLTYEEDEIIGTKAKALREVIEQTYESTQNCLSTNYYGIKQLTTALLPLLQLSDSPKIVNVSSSFGLLKYITNKRAKEELRDIKSLTVEKIDSIVEGFLEDFKAGRVDSEGWPTNFSAYIVSKVALNAYTRVLAKEYPPIAVNCVHPGYVSTDLNGNTGILSVQEGARGPVMLALMKEGGPSGMYFNETEASNFEH
ncbi:(+)-neomenthol dehydrogenase-like [Punica granatum]|uniref:(+)-neomenthol dehydrogenase-like n=2 Tax=Punica granatum TaxID=22663 RepID=A0A6P8DXB5_PUNGR|nr:(+)-neomenthol dehydrogenase-like [Punica granatum]PKI65332.1 hypothetical protein CRG98_014296 [Punica granatum]